MREVLQNHLPQIEQSDVLERLGLQKGGYFLLSAHREENIDNEEHFLSLMAAVNHIAEKYGMPVIYSVHPRSKRMIEQRQFQFHPLVREMKPFGFLDYNKLQLCSYCVLSDSGTLSEESAMLGFAGVLIRTSTERPEVLDKGTVVIGGITGKDVEQAVGACGGHARKQRAHRNGGGLRRYERFGKGGKAHTKLRKDCEYHYVGKR
jgi:UDP-N-acetylglucosamine 2-epimerase (non-hydrolysing)